MLRRFLAVVVFCCVPLIGGAAPQGEDPSGEAVVSLLPKHLKAANAAIDAYLRSDTLAAIKALGPLLGQLKSEQLAALDAYLAERDVPAAGPLLAEARLAAVYQGLADDLPKPKPPETLLLLPAIGEQLQGILDQHAGHAVMAEGGPQPESLREYEELFWSVHVLDNRLQSAQRMADYAAALVKRFPKSILAKASEEQKARVATDYAAISADVAARLADLEERKLELRIDRLTRSADVLEQPRLSKEKFLAAFTASLDAPALEQALAAQANRGRNRPGFQRPRLSGEGLAEEVAATAARASQAAGDLTYKAQLLHAGLHWWLRGRYGSGPDLGGLAKSASAMQSADAQLWLFMPAETPQPTDPASTGPASPTYERRHHYVWALEDRRVASRQTYAQSDESYQHEFSVTTDRFW